MKKSVGLVVMVRVPNQSTPVGHQVMACLQRRGTFNHEKMAPESFPGCLQVTCHGKLSDGEDFSSGLARELQEELGEKFAKMYIHGYHGQVLVEETTEEKAVVTFGTLIPIDFIRDLVRLSPDSGGLIYIKEDEVEDLTPIIIPVIPGHNGTGMKERGPEFTRTMAMFPDEIEAVKKAFEIFGKL